MRQYVKTIAYGLAIFASIGVNKVYADDIFKYHPTYDEGFFMKPYAGLAYTGISADLKTISGVPMDDYFAANYNSINPFVGARIHKNMGVEIGYLNSDNQSKSNGGITTDTDIEAWTLDVMGYYPMPNNKNIELIGLLGIGSYEMKSDLVGLSVSDSDKKIGIRGGLGAQYFLSENVKMRGLVKYIHLDSEVVDNTVEYSMGFAYRF